MTDTVHLRPRRRSLAAIVIGLTAVVAVGCGGGSSFDDKAASTTAPADSDSGTDSGSDSGSDGFSPEAVTLGEEILAQFDLKPSEIDELESGCLGSSLIDALGETDAQGVLETADPSAEQIAALEVSFDACVSGTTLAPAITGIFFGELPGSPTPDQSVVSCMAGEIDGSTGQLISALSSSSDNGDIPQQFLDTLDVCVPDDVVAQLFVAELTSDGTFDTTQATCIADRIAPQIPISTLADAGQSDQLPPDVQQLIEDATVACVLGG